jgi:hypothetical protein
MPTLGVVNDPSARDSGLRQVSLVTKWVAAAGAAMTLAFAVHAASANPGRKVTAGGTSAANGQTGAPGYPTDVRRHTYTGGS